MAAAGGWPPPVSVHVTVASAPSARCARPLPRGSDVARWVGAQLFGAAGSEGAGVARRPLAPPPPPAPRRQRRPAPPAAPPRRLPHPRTAGRTHTGSETASDGRAATTKRRSPVSAKRPGPPRVAPASGATPSSPSRRARYAREPGPGASAAACAAGLPGGPRRLAVPRQPSGRPLLRRRGRPGSRRRGGGRAPAAARAVLRAALRVMPGRAPRAGGLLRAALRQAGPRVTFSGAQGPGGLSVTGVCGGLCTAAGDGLMEEGAGHRPPRGTGVGRARGRPLGLGPFCFLSLPGAQVTSVE